MFEGKYGKLILIGIYVTVFLNTIVLAKEPAEIYIGYVMYLLLLPAFFFRYGLPKWTLLFLVLLVTGFLNIFYGNAELGQFLKIFIGLFVSYLFYYYVVLESNYDVEKLFRYYLKGAYIVSIIGLVQFISFQIGFKPGYDYVWLLNKGGYSTGGNFGIRVNSIIGEPTHYGALISAAFFIALYDLISLKKFYYKKHQSILVIIVYILSFSGVGYIGMILSMALLLFNFGLIRYILLAIPLSIVIFNFMYNNSLEFRLRLDSTVAIFSTGQFAVGATHGSSIILYNNFHIAVENFKSNFLFGSGLGSHPIAAEKYSLTKDISVFGFELNYQDANSMFIRLMSETGLFGLIIFLWILFRFFLRKPLEGESHHWLIANAIFVLITLNLLRQGHYFLNGFPFFIWMYYYNYLSYKKLK